ncbi:MAG: acyl-CoA dehydrogenase family protein [Gammaproteobacteria bacterium]|nr:acyl-CoA dehydrogenase family protein [Gammaproteobacteria bacterium]
MAEIEEFRAETRAWLEENCPKGAIGPGQVPSGSTKVKIESPDTQLWLDRMAEKGWTAPAWPKEYGGGGLNGAEHRVLLEEMREVRARTPLMGMGLSMIGPTLLEFGNEEQRQRHLSRIVRGEVGWCQGYSEPGAGSDLASLRTRAEDKGDHFLINGQKIWTSGAQFADWMFAIVRTDPDVPKHEGISFVLLPMDQEGVTVKPIRLISGTSPFCETFFDDAIAKKEDLVGELNKGWTVAKRLLQFERSGQGGLGAGGGGRRGRRGAGMAEVAKEYIGEESGKIADADVRAKIIRYNIDSAAFALTQRRVGEENRSGKTLGEATSIFKLYGSNLARDGAEMRLELMGVQGLGWEGDAFSSQQLGATRGWLSSRAITIYGGTNEIQMNIIAKRVLGLPD